MQLEPQIQDEIMPKNILMIGPTGVGKTEIARRMAKMMNLPFVKVEATKYTEVGFVGRDVESIVKDLVYNSIKITKAIALEQQNKTIDDMVLDKLAQAILPPLPKQASAEKQEQYKIKLAKVKIQIQAGELDHRMLTIEVKPMVQNIMDDSNMPEGLEKIQESMQQFLSNLNKTKTKKTLPLPEAKKIFEIQIKEELIDNQNINETALKKVEEGGIVFIDELDKVCISNTSGRSQDPSKEGVQRDLLPIVEGSTVKTKYGLVKTDHILFIAAGAFVKSKPSDLIAELQGRFPLRVELEELDETTLYKILNNTKSSLIKQYEALLEVEDIQLEFQQSAVKAMARMARIANQKTEDIGARRLHTILERVLEDISFDIEQYAGQKVVIDEKLVLSKLNDLVENEDYARYIL